jgi:hypothetical protein
MGSYQADGPRCRPGCELVIGLTVCWAVICCLLQETQAFSKLGKGDFLIRGETPFLGV